MCLAAHSKKLLSNTFPENGPFIENVKNAVSYFRNTISLMLKNDPKPSMFIVSIFANGNLKELFSLFLMRNFFHYCYQVIPLHFPLSFL